MAPPEGDQAGHHRAHGLCAPQRHDEVLLFILLLLVVVVVAVVVVVVFIIISVYYDELFLTLLQRHDEALVNYEVINSI